jgi:hypothetical protein
MNGWLYRRAVAIKNFGERVGFHPLIVFGLWLREIVLSRLTIN